MTEMYLSDDCIEIVDEETSTIVSIYYDSGEMAIYKSMTMTIRAFRNSDMPRVDVKKFAQLVGKLS